MKTLKPKPCRFSKCRKSFIPFTSLQVVCPGSIECALGYAEEKRKKKYKKTTATMRRAFLATDRKHQTNKAVTACHAYIMERDRQDPCISCGTTKYSTRYSAGHYLTSGGHPELRFDEDNIHKQCWFNCNKNLSGNIVRYRPNLVKKIGLDRVERLEGPHESANRTIDDLIEIQNFYKKKLKLLQQARAA